MQNRMKTHQLTAEQINELLTKAETATLATINSDGSPYVTPVHYVYKDGKIYIHGLPAGHKVDNIKRNSAVCFNTYSMLGYLLDSEGKPCDTNTAYQSVTVQGNAGFVEEKSEKVKVLNYIVEKYTPQLAGKELPEAMVNGTGVIVLQPVEITGKYWE